MGITCREIIVFAASGPSSSVQIGPFFVDASVKAESVGAKMVNVFGPRKVAFIKVLDEDSG